MERPGERVQIDVKVAPRSCIAAPGLKLYQYTAIDEYSRYRVLGAYEEQSTYSSADFLRKVIAAFKRKGIKVECVQTDNGFEFTNRFCQQSEELPTLFEAEAARLGIRHKLIRPYTPRHNGKVERSHREDQRRFYATHRFWSLDDFGRQLAVCQSRSNDRPMRPLNWLSPRQILSSFNVQFVCQTYTVLRDEQGFEARNTSAKRRAGANILKTSAANLRSGQPATSARNSRRLPSGSSRQLS